MQATWTERRQQALERIETQRAERESTDVLTEWIKATAQVPTWQAYQHRERIPDQLLHYADWFVRETGIHPNTRTVGGWIKELVYWQDNELDLVDLENAWNKSGQGAAFMVTSPFSLSGVAIAMKAKQERNADKYNPTKSVYACPVCGEITCRCEE